MKRAERHRFPRLVAPCAAAMVLALFASIPASMAGVVVYEEGNKRIEIGGRVQLQYLYEDPSSGESTDDIFFRRLRPYIEGTVTENWFAKIQFDLGKAEGDNEIAVKDAFMRYTGLENHDITIGNQKGSFSRTFLTSSKRLELVERQFTGDHNYGSPDRFLGVKLDGKAAGKKVAYSISVGAEDHDPDAWKMDFDTPANANEDFNQGWMAAGRIDFHPLGEMKYDQGDFHTDDAKFTVSLAAFRWSNDDDNNTYTDAAGLATSSTKADLDEATGLEVSGGFRGHGFSADVEYNKVSADTVDPAFDEGIYRNGTTDLDQVSVVGGYMVVKDRLEIVAGWQSQDADGYTDAWERTSVGLNYFWNKYKVKAQLTYEMGENVDGEPGVDEDRAFLQMQFVF